MARQVAAAIGSILLVSAMTACGAPQLDPPVASAIASARLPGTAAATASPTSSVTPTPTPSAKPLYSTRFIAAYRAWYAAYRSAVDAHPTFDQDNAKDKAGLKELMALTTAGQRLPRAHANGFDANWLFAMKALESDYTLAYNTVYRGSPEGKAADDAMDALFPARIRADQIVDAIEEVLDNPTCEVLPVNSAEQVANGAGAISMIC